MFLLLSNHASTSFPAKYLSVGLSFVTALSTTLATRSGGDPFSNMFSTTVAIFCINCKYGEFGSCDFFATTIPLAMFVLITPGSTKTTLIPNGCNSYAIDLFMPALEKFVLVYSDFTGSSDL